MAKSIKKAIFWAVVTAAIGSAVSYYVGKALKGEALLAPKKKASEKPVKKKAPKTKKQVKTNKAAKKK